MDSYLAIEHDLAEYNSSYEPFNESGTMLPPDPELVNETLALENRANVTAEPEDGGYKYSTYEGAEPSAEVPASLDEDGELPPYSIYARYWPNPDEKKDRKPLKYQKLACGHKLRGDGFEPNHRNCERCFFTYFQINGEFTKSVIEAHQAGGDALIVKLKGNTFLHNFKKFMSTVAFIQAQQEATKAKENDESITGPSSGESVDPWESPAYIGGGSVAD